MKYERYTKVVSRCCSLSYKNELNENEFIEILTGKKKLEDKWISHFSTFFSEVPINYIFGVMKELNINFKRLEKLHNTLPLSMQSKRFKELIINE